MWDAVHSDSSMIPYHAYLSEAFRRGGSQAGFRVSDTLSIPRFKIEPDTRLSFSAPFGKKTLTGEGIAVFHAVLISDHVARAG